MPDTPPAMLPGTYVMDQATVDRLATTAAMAAAKAVRDESLTRDDVTEVVDEAVASFLQKAFDIPPGDDKALIELRKDFTAMRAARETREAMVKHGLMAVVGLFMTGIGTAVWLAIKGAK